MSGDRMSGGETGLGDASLEGLPVKLEMFEGPLDLLLHLIKENRVDITDIPIASVTEQYLQYLELMKSLNLDVAGEFLVMAATLMHIKSRLLLPVEDEEGQEEGEDPRLELVRQLQEYEKYREAGLALRDLEEKRSRIFARASIGGDEPRRTDYPLEVSLFELLGALRKLLETVPEKSPMEIKRDQLTVAERISEILDVLQGTEGELDFEDLFRKSRTRSDVVVTFLAVLELMRLRMIRAWQAVPGGRIVVADIRPGGDTPPERSPGDEGGDGPDGEDMYAEEAPAGDSREEA